jgi:hypothetical protein
MGKKPASPARVDLPLKYALSCSVDPHEDVCLAAVFSLGVLLGMFRLATSAQQSEGDLPELTGNTGADRSGDYAYSVLDYQNTPLF